MAIASIIYLLSLIILSLSFINADDDKEVCEHNFIITDCREFIDLDEEANL